MMMMMIFLIVVVFALGDFTVAVDILFLQIYTVYTIYLFVFGYFPKS